MTYLVPLSAWTPGSWSAARIASRPPSGDGPGDGGGRARREQRDDAVAEELVDEAAVLANGGLDVAKILVDEVEGVLGLEPLGDAREAPHVSEWNREIAHHLIARNHVEDALLAELVEEFAGDEAAVGFGQAALRLDGVAQMVHQQRVLEGDRGLGGQDRDELVVGRVERTRQEVVVEIDDGQEVVALPDRRRRHGASVAAGQRSGAPP